MKNTILKYDKIESQKFIAEDYTSKKFRKILTVPELSNTEFIEHIELMDNQTIEQISFILYGTADYWDLLVLINDIDPLFDMVYEFDVIETISEKTVSNYLSDYSGLYKQDTYARLKTLILNRNVQESEERRTIKIIKPEKLFDIITIINKLDI